MINFARERAKRGLGRSREFFLLRIIEKDITTHR